mmetsp:Transcript_12796/g.22121  ORF Transcript_12796/g.22121 Transcript_12796/m.22121 type:complete len:372 (-) Transcript_12796:114-1229(-)
MMRELRIVSALVALSTGFDKKETISVSSLGLIRSEGTLSKRYKLHRQPAVDLEVQLQCNIFSLWEKPSHLQQQPLFERLVLEAWRRHSDGLCKEPILVTDENVRELIPDIPEEYFRLPYPAAKSDFIRYAVLYHHGGVYIDFDMLTVKDVDDIVEKAKALDLVSYSEGRDGGDCKGFSSNFLGGRKNSSFHLAVWEAQKAAVTQHCNLSEKTLEKVCCFDDAKQECHIPWGGLGESISHKVFAAEPPKSAFCFSGDESFNPDRFEFVLEHKQKLEDAKREFEASKVAKPLERASYHFFNAIHGWEKHTCAELFDESTVVGYLFSKSFSNGRGGKPRKGEASDRFLKAHPEFQNVSQNILAHGRSLPCFLES